MSTPPLSTLIEVCVASCEAAIDAESAGANRIELNMALELDGLTPSPALLLRVKHAVQIPIITMARPRAGDFHYSNDEWQTLVADAVWMVENGAAGVAFGVLNADNQVDLPRCRQIRELLPTAELVFHKAFDAVNDASSALDDLMIAKIDRVMTSGLAATALDGAETIRNLVNQANGRIEILPAGRISSQNADQLLKATACTQIHGSFRNSNTLEMAAEVRQVVTVHGLRQ